jgi:small multidrug resistance pump
MGYIYLSIAIVAEVIGTSALKAADGFTKLGPSILVVVGYSVAFYCLSIVFKTIPVGTAYAIWSGAGIALISIIGIVFFQQMLDWPAIIGITLIIAGVATINIFSKVAVH